MDLTVQTRAEGDRTVVEVGGEVDVYTAPALDERLGALIDEGQTRLVLDLTGVDFLDSTGLGVIVKALKRTRERGGGLALVVTEERIRKVFRITGLDAVVPLHSSVESALSEPLAG
ncbi:MAG: STAS domain-containing protein [Candidatus Nanopelagicales bacterium]